MRLFAMPGDSLAAVVALYRPGCLAVPPIGIASLACVASRTQMGNRPVSPAWRRILAGL